MKRWQIVLLTLFAILVASAIGLIHWMHPYDLQTELKAARAAGIPLTAAELNISVPAPDENAATDYRALMALSKRHPLDTAAFDAARKEEPSLAAMDARTAGALTKVISGRPDVARLVHAAAAKPHAHFLHEWTATEEFPQFAEMRECAKWIRWESVLMAREGRYDEAVMNQALGLRITRHACEDPDILGCIVSIACEGLTMQGFQDIMAIAGPNARVADAVRREIAVYTPERDITRSLKAEMVSGISTMRQMTSPADIPALALKEGQWKPSDTPESRFAGWLILNPSKAIYIHWMTRTIEASRAPAAQRAQAMKAVQLDLEHTSRICPTYTLTAILMPEYHQIADSDIRAAARRTLVSSMASVLAYRARTGRYPDSLGSAVQPEPLDPYTGKPLGFRREAAGFAVFAEPDVSGEDALSAAKLRRATTIHYPPITAQAAH